jgi:predicted RNase H-like nuclease
VRALGVDACRAGWVGVELSHEVLVRIAGTLAGLLDAVAGIDAIGVDMPLGFPAAGWRRADALVAARLGPLRSSVFRVPPRAVWAETDYAAANRRCRELIGGGLSVQSYGLRRKVLEANALREAGHTLWEIHPELSFATMNGSPLRHGKKSWAGQAQRRGLLAAQGIVVPDDCGPAGVAAPDDILDAAAVAWSAMRVAEGVATGLPDPPERDDQGVPVAIWC